MRKADEAGEGGGRTAADQLTVEDRSLKAVCQNTIVLSCIMLSDSNNERLVRIVSTIGEPLLQWHISQSKTLRSCSDSLQFLVDQVVGGQYLKHCEDMVSTMTSVSAMEACGFCIEPIAKEVLPFVHLILMFVLAY